MISVRQDIPGFITIDFSNEQGFSESSDKIELTSGLYGVRQLHPHLVVAEDGGQPSAVLFYVWQSLNSAGYKITFDKASSRLLRLFQEEQDLVKRIKKGKIKLPAVASTKFGIVRPLLQHQREAVGHALTVQHSANFSVPGAGKTAIALSIYAVLRHQKVVDGLIVIGPASSFVPWEGEFALTLGRPANVVRLIGVRAHRHRLLRKLDDVDVILCTYQMAHQERQNLARLLSEGRYLLVLDESHHIKNIALGPWARTALELAPFAERRMILTGTPVPHSLQDIWSQFTFLWPTQSVLGTRSQFTRRLETSTQPGDLKKELAPFYRRTKKSDLHLPKPDPRFLKIPAKAIPEYQRLIIRLLELRTNQEARDLGLGKTDISILRRWRRARTLRLIQAASNPALLLKALPLVDLGEMANPLDEDPVLRRLLREHSRRETPAKVAFVETKVRELISMGKKVVVWAAFVDNLHLLEKHLEDLQPLLVYGEVPAYDEDARPGFESRERKIREFNERNSGRNLLLANPAACSESISLHKVCNNAIYLERTFNAGQFLQSMDRIHRVGMPRNTRPHYYVPLVECAIESVIDRRLKARQKQLYDLLEDDMQVLGYDEDTGSFLAEDEDDFDSIFQEILTELSSRADEESDNSSSKGRSRRRTR